MKGARAATVALLALAAGFTTPPAPDAEHRASVAREDRVWIASGWFDQGSSPRDIGYALELCLRTRVGPLPGACQEDMFLDELPSRRTWVSAYGIDRYEVTHARYRRCVLAGACAPSRIPDDDPRVGRPEHPVAGITWSEARAFCSFAGGRLPTEAEWERAARGSGERRFPWGRQYNPRLANHGQPGRRTDGIDGHRHASPVGTYRDGRSPYGLFDAAGNVWEWTADLYDPEAYALEGRIDPRGPASGGERVIRGGSWRSPPHTLRVTWRDSLGQGFSAPDLGVRCAYDP